MKKAFFVLLILLLIIPSLSQAQELDEDCQAYLDERQADVDMLTETLQANDLLLAAIAFAEVRHKYEDMDDVPACVERVHELFIRLSAANLEAITFTALSIADAETTASQLEIIRVRIQRLAEELKEEVAAVESGSTND
jgi:hypothetical protein